MKKRMKLILSVMLLMVILNGCRQNGDVSDSSKNEAFETKKDGVLKMAALTPFESSKEGASLVFDFLTRLDHHYRAMPNLITKWKANENFTEYDLTIQKGVKFHDGTLLDAETVKWNIEKGGAFNYCSYSYVLEGVDIMDSEHLKVKLTAPYLYLERDLGLIPCVPVDGYSEEGKFKTHIGTGAFQFESTDEGEVTTLVRNENYWRSDFDTDVQKILWYTISDEQTRKLALESGKVNVLGATEHYISMPYTVINELKQNNRYGFISEKEDDYTSVGSINTNWKQGILSNLELRKFLSYAIDREKMVKDIFFDIPHACGHVYNPKFEDGPQNQMLFTYSQEEAKKHLEAAGYTVGDLSSPSQDTHGNALKMVLVCSNEEYEKDLALYLKDELAKWGIELEIQSLQGAARYELLKSGNYDLEISHPWFVPLIGSLGFMGLGSEYSDYGLGFCVNDEMKTASEAYLQATNKEIAKGYADEIWKIQYEQIISIPLFADIRYIIHDKVFDGFHFDGNVFCIDLNGVKYK